MLNNFTCLENKPDGNYVNCKDNSCQNKFLSTFRFEFASAKSKVIIMVKGKLPSKEKMPESVYNMYVTSSNPNCLEKLRQLITLQGSREAIFN